MLVFIRCRYHDEPDRCGPCSWGTYSVKKQPTRLPVDLFNFNSFIQQLSMSPAVDQALCWVPGVLGEQDQPESWASRDLQPVGQTSDT